MVIIDGHAHVFPYLGGACGWKSVAAHKAALQDSMLSAARPGVKYGSTEAKGVLPGEPSDVRFRVGKFGRFEWSEGGTDYYRQYMPPSLQDQTASPEFMLAQMDHAGIDMAVLQNAKLYGKLNDCFAECARSYPDRFIGLAEITELEADRESEIQRLRHAIRDLGLKGIYYEATRFLGAGDPGGFNDTKFDIFWREVSNLEVPVHWSVVSSRMPAGLYMEQMRLFSAWADRFPDIASVVVQALFARPFRKNGEVRFPEELLAIFKKPNVFAEVTYPISAGPLGWDYPYPQFRELVRQQYEEFGAQKLVWGSDMPNVERNCTYRQSLCYLKDYCDFINLKDMGLILGGNMARILKVRTDVPGAPRPKLADIA